MCQAHHHPDLVKNDPIFVHRVRVVDLLSTKHIVAVFGLALHRFHLLFCTYKKREANEACEAAMSNMDYGTGQVKLKLMCIHLS